MHQNRKTDHLNTTEIPEINTITCINNLSYTDDTTLIAESEEKLKGFLLRVIEESEKAGLKFNIEKSKIMASSPITLWQI